MSASSIWLKWSWRDLRKRWLQVIAIAFVIALGTGTYASLTASTRWRTLSADDAYARTNMFDLRVELTEGSFVPQGTLAGLSNQLLRESAGVSGFQERLIVPTQVRTEESGEEILVRGRIIGWGDAGGGEWIAAPYVMTGEGLESAAGTVLLEHNFAKRYSLPDSGTIQIGGATAVSYSGQAIAPEYFYVVTGEGGILELSRFALIYTSLDEAQTLAGAGPVVNDLLLTLPPGTDVESARASVQSTLETALPDVGFTIDTREQDEVWGAIYNDIDGDQRFFNIFSIAIVSGAVFASFNLVTRMVESQRREIGIALALGLPPWKVAIRPMLAAAQIAALGVVFGVLVGIGIGSLMGGVFVSFLPLPQWQTPFQFGLYAWVALAGFGAPFLASLYPVFRAVSVPPVNAIRTGHLASRGGGVFTILHRVPLPGSTLAQLPFRNLLRAPRRALLTALGVAATITVLVAVVGMVDSFVNVIDSGAAEIEGDSPDRLAIQLDMPYPVNAPNIQAIHDSPLLERTEGSLQLGGQLVVDDNEEDDIDLLIQVIDFNSEMWRPTVSKGSLDTSQPGLLIAQKAANDLGLKPGSSVTLRHPALTGQGTFTLVETEMTVIGIHPHPFRFVTYMDYSHADLFGLAGTVNTISAEPAAGVTPDEVARALFDVPGVVSTEPVTLVADIFRDLIGQFIGLLQILEGVVLLLALLIAFNTSSISIDERLREHATMFAFGISPLRALSMAVIESGVIGIASTLLGLLGGYLFMAWTLQVTSEDVSPDLLVPPVITGSTVAIALALGALAVAAAPLLNYRKLRNMDIPSTLRVME